MSVRVLKAGLLTTVQDLGRHGLQHLGIVPCGAMDLVSHRLANALVGNADQAATLECTVLGPELAFEQDTLVALYGAQFAAKLGRDAFPLNRPVLVKAGARLRMGAVARAESGVMRGARAYLAVAGGFELPAVLGSRSTFAPAGSGGFGGIAGRGLRPGDRLPCADNAAGLATQRYARLAGPRQRRMIDIGSACSVRWSIPALTLPAAPDTLVHALEGRHASQFDADALGAFFGEKFHVSADSNRMGYRLAGPRLARSMDAEILSEPTCLGTVQVPNNGIPIVLMADHQTSGGYPKIAEVASADIACLAQLAPGASVRFVQCTLEQADGLRKDANEQLRRVRQAIEWEYAR